MLRRPPRSTRTYTLFPYTTRFRSYADRTSSPFYAGKIDAVIVDGQRLEFTYFNTSGTTVRNIYNAYNPETNMSGPYSSTQLFEYGGENYVGRYTGQFTDWLTISAAYGKNKNRANQVYRSAERRVGEECVRTGRSRG